MVNKLGLQRIVVDFRIEGDAEAVLVEIQKMNRVGARMARVAVEVRGAPYERYTELYWLPAIKAGDTSEAHQTLMVISDQNRVNRETDNELGGLLVKLGELTK